MSRGIHGSQSPQQKIRVRGGDCEHCRIMRHRRDIPATATVRPGMWDFIVYSIQMYYRSQPGCGSRGGQSIVREETWQDHRRQNDGGGNGVLRGAAAGIRRISAPRGAVPGCAGAGSSLYSYSSLPAGKYLRTLWEFRIPRFGDYPKEQPIFNITTLPAGCGYPNLKSASCPKRYGKEEDYSICRNIRRSLNHYE